MKIEGAVRNARARVFEFVFRNNARLSRDRIFRKRGDSLLVFSTPVTSSIRPALPKERAPRSVCDRYGRERPTPGRDIRPTACHPSSPRNTVDRALSRFCGPCSLFACRRVFNHVCDFLRMGEHRDMTGWQNKGDRTYLLRHALSCSGAIILSLLATMNHDGLLCQAAADGFASKIAPAV